MFKNEKSRRYPFQGRAVYALLMVFLTVLACGIPAQVIPNTGEQQQQPTQLPPQQLATVNARPVATQQTIPTLTPAAPSAGPSAGQAPGVSSQELVRLHDQLAPGVVNITVFINQQGDTGEAAGSGFVLDDQGHIVTNNHVVAGANQVIVVFFNGVEAEAQVVSTDPDSDLAVLHVDNYPDGVHPLQLADSDKVQVGEWVIAIGNPFALGSSMSIGIVSAIGRTIQSGATPFSIPEAIQTDAAINPGNSGGPLLDLNGQVIGVNAQIATGGTTQANTGVGFAIPSNVVRKVAPVLIQGKKYQWPWLGVRGTNLTLPLAQANGLNMQQGAYIDSVDPNSPAGQAGLQGSTGTAGQLGIPAGGDVVIAVDGQPVTSFDQMLKYIAFKNPGDQVTLTILRNGQQREVTITLAPRPTNLNPGQSVFP